MRDSLLFLLGLVFLVAAKAKYLVSGYSTPKPFSLTEDCERCIAYDWALANRYEENLYRLTRSTIAGKRILELGPGSDLGIGMLLVARGAKQYVGFDRHDLARDVPIGFYERLRDLHGVDLRALSDGRVSYVARDDFDLEQGLSQKFDLVISNAAFEHFDDVERTIRQATALVDAGGTVLIEVDLQTHSRWIREHDPNNIYRYPEWLYRTFRFPGQPNRVRPQAYRDAFERAGWGTVNLEIANLLPEKFLDRQVSARFRDQSMQILSFILGATEPPRESVGSRYRTY